MKNFLLVPNFERNSLPYVRRAEAFLREKGCAVYCRAEDASLIGADVCRDTDEDMQKIDCILVFGGDGTMLKAIKRYLIFQKPFVGINTGKVGYLSDVDPERLEESLGRVLEGQYSIEKRVTLRVETDEGVFVGVNEAVLHRASAHVLGVEMTVNKQRIEQVRADGIMVATPTGSTAYNLSAGGPILIPGSKNMVITPICAHSLSIRPIVIGAGDTVMLTVGSADEPAFVNVDGEKASVLEQGASVKISLSDCYFTLLRLSEGNFFTVLRNKLLTWEQ